MNPKRLSRRLFRAINDARNELWISPISTWEIVLLYEKGRLKLADGPESWVQRALSLAPLREAPVTPTRSLWRHVRSAFPIAIQPTGYGWQLR
jgi:PIN domain nuclease of toxin-antitoxin system